MKKKVLFISLLILLCVFFTLAASAEEVGPAIAVQPQQDVTVNFPDGITLTVVPENPDEVASYQWYFVDSSGSVFELDGTSATTDTLICPSTRRYLDETYFYCVLTGTNGKTTQSENAYVTVENYFESFRMLGISGYTITAGETLNLDETELGSGSISYSEDGTAITFDNVYFDNTNVLSDHILNEVSITLDDYATDISSLDIILKGDNVLNNTFYQESSNGSGVTLDLYFEGKDEGTAPTVRVTGNGTMTFIGGTIQLRTNGDLEIDAPLTFQRNGDYFCDAVNGYSVTVGENVPLTFDVNGTLIFASTDITVNKGASIDAKTSAPYVAGDYTNKNGFLCGGNVLIDNATVKMELSADPDRFIPNGLAIVNFIGINAYGNINIYQSSVEVTQTADESETPYFYYGSGISGLDLYITESDVSVNLDSDEIMSSHGVFAEGNLCITDSTVDVYTHTAGRAFGIGVNGELSVTDSVVTNDTASADGDCYGIMCGTADVTFSEEGQKLESYAQDGIALGANIGTGTEAVPFDADYVPTAIVTGENTVFETPEDCALNRGNMLYAADEFGEEYIYLETPYSLSDTDLPVTHTVITYRAETPAPDTDPEDEEPEDIEPEDDEPVVPEPEDIEPEDDTPEHTDPKPDTDNQPAPKPTPSGNDAPDTGDDTHITLWLAASLVSAALALALIFMKKAGKNR